MKNFVPFLLALFLIAALLRIDFFFTVAYLFFAVYLLARLWTQYARNNVRVQRQFVDHAFYGDQVAVEVALRNTGWLPILWLEAHEALSIHLSSPPFHRHVLSLGPRQQRRFHYTLNCQRRGYYPIGPLTTHAGDMLGIDTRRLPEVKPEHIIVYPHIYPLHKLGLPTRSPLVVLPARTPLFEDPARVRGIREYQRGDSLRRIHWTASAHARQLVVKQYQPAIARETLISLNLNEADYDTHQRFTAAELSITVAASLASHIILTEKQPVGLITEAQDMRVKALARVFLPPRPKRAQLMRILEALACAHIAPATAFPELLRQASVKLAWGTTLVVITSHAPEDLLDTLGYLQRAGFAVALVLVQPKQSASAMQAQVGRLGIQIYQVWKEHDIAEWR